MARSALVGLVLALLVACTRSQQSNITCANGNIGDGFYQFSKTTLDGDTIHFSQYQGKVVLVTNVASF